MTGAAGELGPRRLPRPPRSWPPPPCEEPVVVAAPPPVDESERGGLLAALLPAVSGLGILAWAVTGGSRLLLWLGIGMVVLMLSAGLLMRRGSRRAARRRAEQRRERYRAHLVSVVATLAEAARRQCEAAIDAHPPPETWGVRATSGERLWERRPGDPDALHVRLGRGRVRLSTHVRYDPPDVGLQEPDPELDAAARAVITDGTSIEEHPVILDLAAGSPIAVVGAGAGADTQRAAADLVRSLVLELACARPPTELVLVGLAVPEADQPWLHRLPHSRGLVDDSASARLLLRPMLGPSASPVPVLLARCSATDPAAAPEVVSRLTEEVVAAGGVAVVTAARIEDVPPGVRTVVTVSDAGPAWIRSSGEGTPDRCVARLDAMPAAGAAPVAADLSRWSCPADGAEAASTTLPTLLDSARRSHPDGLSALRVPLGLDADGRPVVLDLDEAARGGDGPHGLIVGATGSGKSELLRTLVGGLLTTRGQGQLAVVLVDYKGGATFRGLERLPHVAGHVTNLDSDDLTVRFADALGGELDRRQRLLRDVGFPDLDSWRHSGGAQAAPPPLLIVIDEFTELLEAAPDLLAVMVRTCRVGRSLGVHLLLATQRLDEGRLAGLDGHLRYRLCLRTGSAGESRVVLGSDVAALLPARPGAALLAVDGRLSRLQVARCSDADLREAAEHMLAPGLSEPTRAIWQAPLPHRLSLPEAADAASAADALHPTIGLVDRPRQQDQAPLRLDLGGAGGHVAVAGAPLSGTTTALQTLVCALALAHDPRHLQVLAVASAGSGLQALQVLPHVGTVAGSGQPELIRRTVLDTLDIVRRRATELAAAGLLSAQQWRDDGRPCTDGRGELLLVIDGWAGLQQDDELAAATAEIAANGLGVGVHLVVSVRSWVELRGPVRATFGSRLELRLQDPYESEVDRKVAARIPADVPGRVVLPGGLVGQLALPALVTTGAADRPGLVKAAPVRLLPARLSLPSRRDRGHRLMLGVAESGLAPQYLTERDGRHLLVLGDAGSGRTSVLTALVRQHLERGSPVHLIDPRGTSAGLREAVASYTTSMAGVEALAAALGESPTGAVVVVDDYDLLARGLASPLAALVDRLDAAPAPGQAVALVLARRVGGFARACFDPVLQRLLELSTCALLLDGDPAEGPVLGAVRPRSLPPGRALLVRRGRPPTLVQTVVSEPGNRGAPVAVGVNSHT